MAFSNKATGIISILFSGFKSLSCKDRVSFDWNNYLLTNDRSTRGKYRAKVGQRLTPIQNELMVRAKW